jgi:hypothetical protein
MPLSKQIQKRNEEEKTEGLIAMLVIGATILFIALMFYYGNMLSY